MGSRLAIRWRDRYIGSVGGGEWIMLGIIAFALTGVAAFVRHCWWTLGLLMSDAPLTAGKAVLAVLGILMPPLGCLHGVWLWFH